MRNLIQVSWFKPIILCLVFTSISLISHDIHAARSVQIQKKEDLNHTSGRLGTYKALVIGIDKYQDPKIPALKTAVNDARKFGNLLKVRYGFNVTFLLDRQATKKAIYQKLRGFAADTNPDESVLIYFAGHGEIDRVLNDGWWVPADAKAGDSETYLDNTVVQKVMSSMKARHVLLVSDSCYSGTLFGESRSLPPLIDDKYYLNLYNEKSRWGMTSGNKTPVSDSGSSGHSIFAYQLIKALQKNEKPYITTQEIYAQIAPIIANNSEQQPLCSPIRGTGDQGGGFVFVDSIIAGNVNAKKSITYGEADKKQFDEEEARIKKERQELEQKKIWIERKKKIEIERKRLEEERKKLAAVYNQPEKKSVLEQVVGNWEGVGRQDNNTTWTIRMKIMNHSYSIDYPSLQCGGNLTLLSQSGDRIEFREEINYGKTKCVNNGKVVIMRSDENSIKWLWYYPNGNHGADSILRKSN